MVSKPIDRLWGHKAVVMLDVHGYRCDVNAFEITERGDVVVNMTKVLKAVSRLTGPPIMPGLGIGTVPCDACRGTGRRSTPNPYTDGRVPCRRCDGAGTARRTPTDPTKVSP